MLLHGNVGTWDHDAFVALVQEAGGQVPRNADQLLKLRLMLEKVLSSEHSCLIATYIGTGRSEANTSKVETGTQTAEEYCGTDGWIFDTTVEDAYAAAAKILPPEDYSVLDSWGKQKSVKALSDVQRNVQQDVDKLKWTFGGIAGTAILVALGVWILQRQR